MGDYIVCPNKRNTPRLDVRVCREKCVSKGDCDAYSAYLKICVKEQEIPSLPEAPALPLGRGGENPLSPLQKA